MKKCSKCAEEKPETEFYRRGDGQGVSGLRSCCKNCSTRSKASWRSGNAAHVNATKRNWYTANGARLRAARRASHPPRTPAQKAWRNTNRAALTAYEAARRGLVLQASPRWGNPVSIRLVYEAAAMVGLQVDHIVPLRSPLVCGLHVEHNLQLLPLAENVSKGNRHWPDMP